MRNLIITGHRKSGTSLLSSLFDEHPEVSVYPTDISILYAFFPKFTKLYKNKPIFYNARLKKVIFKSLKNSGKSFGAQKSSSKYATEVFNSFRKIPKKHRNNPKKLVQFLINGFLKSQKKLRENVKRNILIKETSVISYMPSLLDKKTKIIVLIRDPRDNFAAINAGVKKYYSKFGEDELTALASTINRIKFDLSLASHYKKIKDKKFFFIKFETLVASPKKTIQRLCRFCKIKFNVKLLKPTVHGKPAGGNNFDGIRFASISNKNIGQYKKRLPSVYIKVIEWFLEKEMKDWGYIKKPLKLKESYLKAIEAFYQWYNIKYFFKDSFK